MSLYLRLSKEDRKKLRRIFAEEHKFLLKRPQYIIGNILMALLIFYFLFKGLLGGLDVCVAIAGPYPLRS